MLLILGQPERTVMSLMGWSTTDMVKRYQYVTDSVRATAAEQMGSLTWDTQTHDAIELVAVRRDALATVLQPFAADVLNLDDVDLDPGELQAALTHLHTAIATPDNAPNGETK